jgi:chitinase
VPLEAWDSHPPVKHLLSQIRSVASVFARDAFLSHDVKIWNLFLGGSSSTRPFGAAVLDGCVCRRVGGGYSSLTCRVTASTSILKEAARSFSTRL